jgi:glycosyltransferase involved in cell wall biosynthesis
MRILAITAGSPSQFTPILDAMALRGDEVVTLSPSHSFARIARGSFTFARAHHPEGPLVSRSRQSFHSTSLSVADALRQINMKFDVIFGQASFGLLGEVASTSGIPVVAHVELPSRELASARPDFPPTEEELAADVSRRWMVECALRQAKRVIVPSLHAKRQLSEDIHARTRVCPEAHVTAPRPPDADLSNMRSCHGLPKGPVLGFFGRTLEAVRGFDIFLDALLLIRRVIPGAHAVVVGEDSTLYGNTSQRNLPKSFRDFALSSRGMRIESCDFRGKVPSDTFHQLMAAVDVALFPIFESAGQWSLYECLAAGTPVVASNRCFIPEVVRHGVNGYLCPVEDPAAFAEHAVRILSNSGERRRLSLGAWESMRNEYTIDVAEGRFRAAFAEAALSSVV